MDTIEIQMNPDGSFDLPAIHVAPYVAAVDPPVDSASPTDPPPLSVPPPVIAPTLSGLVLTADKDVTALKVGDTFTLSAVLTYSDGSTKQVSANAFSGFDKAVVTSPNSWTATFTAVAPGTTTITDSSAGMAGRLKVTVLDMDGSAPPVAQPPSDPPQTSPTPTGADKVTFRSALAVVGRRAIFSAWAIPNGSPVSSATLDWGDGTSQPINTIYQAMRHDYPSDGDYTITLNAVAMNGDYGSKTIAVLVAQLATPPDPTPTADDVAHLTAVLADGSTLDVTANQGQRVTLDASRPQLGSIIFHLDGKSVCVENAYAGCTGDLAGHFKLSVGGKMLWDDLDVIWAHARTHPFWVVQPSIRPDADLTKFGKWGPAGASATMIDSYRAADNGPMGVSAMPPGIGSGGEREGLGGPLRGADAMYVANPSADNATVVRGLADAASVWGFHVIDPATQKMLDVTQYPKVTMNDTLLGVSGNPIAKYTSNSPLSLSQASTHATPFCALSAELYGTDYDREELALWANYVGSIQENYSYRLPAGCIGAGGAARGKARTLTVVMYAATLSDHPEYFAAWVNAMADAYNATFPTQTGVQIDQKAAASEGYQGGSAAYAEWQQLMFVETLGHCIDNGFTRFQPTFDYFAISALDAMLAAPHELLTLYNKNWKDAAGNIAQDMAQVLAFTGAANAKVAAALQCAEGSAAMQTALGQPTHPPGDFVCGDGTDSVNYIAQAQGAYARLADHATDQVRAQAAWAKLMQFSRVDYSKNPKYNLVPRAA